MVALYGTVERRLGLLVVVGCQSKVSERRHFRLRRRRWDRMGRRLVILPFVNNFSHPGETKNFIVPRVEFGDDVEDEGWGLLGRILHRHRGDGNESSKGYELFLQLFLCSCLFDPVLEWNLVSKGGKMILMII